MDSFTKLDKELKHMDLELCDLYFKAVKSLLDMNDDSNIKQFCRYLDELRRVANANCEFYEDSEDNDGSLRTLLHDTLFYRIAYVYRNSTLYSSAMAFHFQNVLDSNPNILERLLQKKTIRLCSLGCGPASDIVAVVKVIESAARVRGVAADITVTVVDADSSWKNTCLAVLRCLPMFEKATWKVKFIQADLSQFFSLETVDAIQNADIVTLMRFSSEFASGFMSCRDTIKEISEIISHGSLLFFMDRSNYDVMKSSGGIQGHLPNFCLVYEEIFDFFNLHLEAVKKNYQLYEEHFGARVCNTCFKVFCRVWVRSECGYDNLRNSPGSSRTESMSSSDSQIRVTEFGFCSASPSRSDKSESGINSEKPENYCDDRLLPQWLKTKENKSMVRASLPSDSSLPVYEAENCKKLSNSVDGNSNSSSATENAKCNSNGNVAVETFKLRPQLPDIGDIEEYSHQEACGKVLHKESATGCDTNKPCLMYYPRKRFENKREKFNAFEFFRVRPYRAWHQNFCKLMEKEAGWSWKAMDDYYQSYEKMWEKLFLKLDKQTKRMEHAKKRLISHQLQLSGDMDHGIWKEFMASKRELAFIKRTIYCEIVITFRGYLKSLFPLRITE